MPKKSKKPRVKNSDFAISDYSYYKFWIPNKTADQIEWIRGRLKVQNYVIAMMYITDFVFNILKQQGDSSYRQSQAAVSGIKFNENT